MSAQWKPGDVALVSIQDGGKGVRMLTLAPGERDAGSPGQWWGACDDNSTRFYRADSELIESIRPLLVIDPDDREQVKAVLAAYGDQFTDWKPQLDGSNVTRLQAALRSLLTPPKPDEPLLIAAVVEDARGRLWVRTDDADCVNPWSMNGSGEQVEWSEVPAVKVLSEGVTS